jgi:hypothetical protein
LGRDLISFCFCCALKACDRAKRKKFKQTKKNSKAKLVIRVDEGECNVRDEPRELNICRSKSRTIRRILRLATFQVAGTIELFGGKHK